MKTDNKALSQDVAPGVNYALLDTIEHRNWKSHRELMSHVDERDAGYRGCVGLAMLINSTNADSWLQLPSLAGTTKTFVPDSTVEWASMVDVPLGYFRLSTGDSKVHRNREVHWATARKTTMKFGMPHLVRGSEGDRAWDFRSIPHGKTVVKPAFSGGKTFTVQPPKDVLNTDTNRQLFRVFNAIEWAMTTTAFAFRANWAYAKIALHKALGYAKDPGVKILAYGDGFYDGAAPPSAWMPKAYLAFPERLREGIFDRATRPVPDSDVPPAYGEGLRWAFVDALGDALAYRAPFSGTVSSVQRRLYRGIPVVSVMLRGDQGEVAIVPFFQETARIVKAPRSRFLAGDIIGEERLDRDLPENWYTIQPAKRWEQFAPNLVHPRIVDAVMRLWFLRSGVNLVDGFVHYPSRMASVAALSAASDEHLFWEVSDSLEYFRDDADALIFPPIPVRGWADLTGYLPGEVSYDLNPADSRYESYYDQRVRIDRLREGICEVIDENSDPALIEADAVQRRMDIIKAWEWAEARAESETMLKAFTKNAAPAAVVPKKKEENPGIQLSPEEQEKIRLKAIKAPRKKSERVGKK